MMELWCGQSCSSAAMGGRQTVAGLQAGVDSGGLGSAGSPGPTGVQSSSSGTSSTSSSSSFREAESPGRAQHWAPATGSIASVVDAATMHSSSSTRACSFLKYTTVRSSISSLNSFCPPPDFRDSVSVGSSGGTSSLRACKASLIFSRRALSIREWLHLRVASRVLLGTVEEGRPRRGNMGESWGDMTVADDAGDGGYDPAGQLLSAVGNGGRQTGYQRTLYHMGRSNAAYLCRIMACWDSPLPTIGTRPGYYAYLSSSSMCSTL